MALNEKDNFVLCDASSGRLPILHASSGFQKMYGPSESSFLDVMEAKVRPESLYHVADAELGVLEIEDGMNFLAAEVKNYAQEVLQEQVEHPRLFISQKSCGQLFTCEMQLMQKHHPSLNWAYVVATQRDVTSAVPVADVLKAAQSPSSYSMLCTRWARQQKNGSTPDLTTDLDQDFHQIVHRAWRDKISKKLVDENACDKMTSRCEEVRTLASVSTACSMSSLARRNDGSGTSADASGIQRGPMSPCSPCFHLGALAHTTTASTDDPKMTESTERSDSEDRDRNLFLAETEPEPNCTEELPEPICCSPLSSLPFNFFILDPRHEELPFVLGSHKFACDAMADDFLLTSFHSLFLNAKSTSTHAHFSAFWSASRKGQFLEESTGAGSLGEVHVEADLCSSKAGAELVPCTMILKQVELDDVLFVAGVSYPSVMGAQQQNNLNLDQAIEVMSSEFFFSAPMRRQTAV